MTPLEVRLRKERGAFFAELAKATLENTQSTAQICAAWSDFADQCITEAFRGASARVSVDHDLAVFAYGKLGAQELNLSSDVDLLVVSKEFSESHSAWLREFRKILGDKTEDGFVFRLDFDLRPGGRMGPLIPTLAQFEDYFSNYGEAWERLAFVRFRSICGEESLMDLCLQIANRFTYRRHLDFALLDDLKTLRQRIFEQNWQRSLDGRIDLKLGPGGIRDLELFVHTHQVVNGGRHPQVRGGSTEMAIKSLVEISALPQDEALFFIRHYWTLRHFENCLQGLTDQQIQVLDPRNPSLHFETPSLLALQNDMRRASEIVSGFLGVVDMSSRSLPDGDTELNAWLDSLGFDPGIFQDPLALVLRKNVLSRSPERDDLFRRRFLYEMLLRFSRGHFKDRAVLFLIDLLTAIRAKSYFYHLLLNAPRLMDRLSAILLVSPYLTRVLISRPELIESFLLGQLSPTQPNDWDLFLQEQLDRKLILEMTTGIEFLRTQDVLLLAKSNSQIADEIVESILGRLNREFNSEVDILAMGKWGGHELGIRSDLDLVLVSETEPTENDFKCARRVVSRLTETQRGGALFSLDFRLKPHGRGGPLLVSKEGLLKYLKSEAAPWERQAYLKARSLRNPSWSQDIRNAILSQPLLREDLLQLRNIRAELLSNRSNLDVKYSAGGLLDIEFATQIYLLTDATFTPGNSLQNWLDLWGKQNSDWAQIQRNYLSLRSIEQTFQLLSQQAKSEFEASRELLTEFALLFELPDSDSISRRIHSLLSENAALLAHLDPRQGPG